MAGRRRIEVPMVYDSRHMDSARLRNVHIQQKLRKTLKSLDRDWENTKCRIRTEQRYLLRSLSDLRLDTMKLIVVPRGLSAEQRERYLETRKEENTFSISLNEFDERMAKFKSDKKRTAHGAYCHHHDPKSGHVFAAPNRKSHLLEHGFHFDLVTRPQTSYVPQEHLTRTRRFPPSRQQQQQQQRFSPPDPRNHSTPVSSMRPQSVRRQRTALF